MVVVKLKASTVSLYCTNEYTELLKEGNKISFKVYYSFLSSKMENKIKVD